LRIIDVDAHLHEPLVMDLGPREREWFFAGAGDLIGV
jgi:hypothetical protein